jgi:hypothetical protein
MRERIKWKVRRTASKIVANESIIGEGSPTYLVQFDSDSFHMGADTLCIPTLSRNKDHFDILK